MTYSSHSRSQKMIRRSMIRSKKNLTHFTKKKNTIYERAKFNSRKQEGEPVEVFITALHKLAEKCEYSALREEMIRDRIVVRIRNQRLSERMQLDEKLTLASATKQAREMEGVKSQQSELKDRETKDHWMLPKNVDTLSGKRNQKRRPPPPQHLKRSGATGGPRQNARQQSTHKNPKVCTRCGNDHFQRVCRNTINEIKLDNGDTTDNKFLGAISTHEGEPWVVTLLVNKSPITFKIDTGADVTVIPDTV